MDELMAKSIQIPAIFKAAIGNPLKFNIRIEFGGETTPDPEAVKKSTGYSLRCPTS